MQQPRRGEAQEACSCRVRSQRSPAGLWASSETARDCMLCLQNVTQGNDILARPRICVTARMGCCKCG